MITSNNGPVANRRGVAKPVVKAFQATTIATTVYRDPKLDPGVRGSRFLLRDDHTRTGSRPLHRVGRDPALVESRIGAVTLGPGSGRLASRMHVFASFRVSPRFPIAQRVHSRASAAFPRLRITKSSA